jgi:hypothetical protein
MSPARDSFLVAGPQHLDATLTVSRQVLGLISGRLDQVVPRATNRRPALPQSLD